jgi:sec-independent protein translocase protein TatC
MSETPEDLVDDKMPLLDHLVELRSRLLYAAVALVLSFLVCFYFAAPIFNFLVAPLTELWAGQSSKRLIYTALHEKFFTEIKVAFFAGTFLAFPIIANQIWKFVAPGLYRNEKGAFLPFLIATPVLFFTGGAFVYYFVFPVAWAFFAGFEQAATAGNLAIELEPKVDQYLYLVMRLIFAFGLSFELPVILMLLTRSGLVAVETLKKKRRYAVVFAFIAAAILTPPDPLSQVALAVPIIILYEISIWCSVLLERKKKKMEDAEAEND